MTASLRLERVTAGYGARRVLDGLDLELTTGTLTALLGPSGCGKTTVLSVIAGLLPIVSGEMWLDAERVSRVAPERRGIGVVMQKPSLFPHLSVADNVGFGLQMRGVARAQRRAAADEALRLVQLEGFGDRKPASLSGGQEQRVALARALVLAPRVLLLDEPLSALDEELRGEMRALLRGLQQRLGVTTLFITHDQQEAVAVADQVAVILDGRIAQAGPARLFYTEPATVSVARFFGWAVIPRAAVTEAGADPTATLMAFHPSAATLGPWGEMPDTGVTSVPVMIERVVDVGTGFRIIARLPTAESIEISQPGPADDRPNATAVAAAACLRVPTTRIRYFRA
ncbi:MAG: ABC transporter ATP-binding protein [Vicinamibacterales bacterium]